MPISIPYAALHEHSERMKRRTLDVRVTNDTNHRALGRALAKSIKIMEERPDLSTNAAFAEVIAEEAGCDIKIAASLGVELGRQYGELLSQEHGAKYYDLAVVSINDGENEPANTEANALQKDLAGILGEDRVCGGQRIEGKAAEGMDNALEDAIEKGRERMDQLTAGHSIR